MFSYILNIVLLLVLAFYAYHKRSLIVPFVKYILGGGKHGKEPTEEELKAFNNQPLEIRNDRFMINGKSKITILFLGNSLTYTGVPEEEEDKTPRGLTSTAPEYDYVHRLVKYIATRKNMNVEYSILNIVAWERTFPGHPFSMSLLEKINVKQPDLLIVQCGENVMQEDLKQPERFVNSYCQLLSLFPHSKKIITLPFWPEKVRDYAITEVATRSNAYLVDLGHLGDGTDPDNFAWSHRTYKKPGVGQHPGDKGMKRIADCIYATVNAIYNLR